MLYERLGRVICENDEKVGGRREATLQSQQAEPGNKIRGLSTPLANKYYQGKKEKKTKHGQKSLRVQIPSLHIAQLHQVEKKGRDTFMTTRLAQTSLQVAT